MNPIRVTAKDRPLWYNFRWKLSNGFIWIARKIYPENPELKAFLLEMMTDQLIYGQTFYRVNPRDLTERPM